MNERTRSCKIEIEPLAAAQTYNSHPNAWYRPAPPHIIIHNSLQFNTNINIINTIFSAVYSTADRTARCPRLYPLSAGEQKPWKEANEGRIIMCSLFKYLVLASMRKALYTFSSPSAYEFASVRFHDRPTISYLHLFFWLRAYIAISNENAYYMNGDGGSNSKPTTQHGIKKTMIQKYRRARTHGHANRIPRVIAREEHCSQNIVCESSALRD